MNPNTAFVCPLSWGLGHATRCIPVVRALQAEGFTVILGGSGRSGLLLQQRFPELKFIPTPFRDVKLYAGLPVWAGVLMQLPAFMREIRRERTFAQRVIKEQNLSVLISDNRYGMYAPGVRSILITHQLRVRHPKFLKPFEALSAWLLKRLTGKFSEVWVPDFSGADNLTGELSRPTDSRNKRIRFVGPLSRFSATDRADAVIPNKVVVVISGPEPSRQTFEDGVRTAALNAGRAITIIGGKPESETAHKAGPVTLYPHLNDESFAQEVTSAEYIVASGGYSTIMDLAALNCRATLIPFPGQTEQEYLAARLHGRGMFSSLTLKSLNFSEIDRWGLSNLKNHNQPNNQLLPGTELQDAIRTLRQ